MPSSITHMYPLFESRMATLRSVALGTMVLAASLSAQSEVSGSFVINGDGTITYFYTLNNQSGTFDLAAWSLDLDIPSPDWDPTDTFSGGDVTVPDLLWFADAGIPVTGTFAQDFLALDPAGDVPVGAVLAGFSFTSSLPPGPVTYHEFSALGDSASGTTVGPTAAVPEASTWVSGLTLGMLAGRWVLRRRHPIAPKA